MGKEKFKAGGSDGVTVWKRWCGEDTNIQVFGWEMKFEVDANGNVSGGNKNDDNGNDIKKFYSGTFINDQMDVQVEWTDGRKCTYKGGVVGNCLKVEFELTALGTQGGNLGDHGFNEGTFFRNY